MQEPWGISTKFHAVVTRGGQFVKGMLTGGKVHDMVVAAKLNEDIAGYAVIADGGYDSDGFRRELEGNNNLPVIPGRKNRKEEIEYDKEKYKSLFNIFLATAMYPLGKIVRQAAPCTAFFENVQNRAKNIIRVVCTGVCHLPG